MRGEERAKRAVVELTSIIGTELEDGAPELGGYIRMKSDEYLKDI